MDLIKISKVLQNTDLEVRLKHDRVSDFRFLSVSRQFSTLQPAFMVHTEDDFCIVETGVAGVLTITADPHVSAQTISQYYEIYDQGSEYDLYRAINDIKLEGYVALFEDNNIYIYQLTSIDKSIERYEVDERIRLMKIFDKENPYCLLRYTGKQWTYQSRESHVETFNLSLEKCVELFKSQINIA